MGCDTFELRVNVGRLNIAINSPEDAFVLAICPDMQVCSYKKCTTFEWNLSRGKNRLGEREWLFHIRNEFAHKHTQIPLLSGIRFSLYARQESDEKKFMRRHVADGVLYFHTILNSGQETFSVTLWDYPKLAEEILSNPKTAMQDRDSDARATLQLTIQNIDELKQYIESVRGMDVDKHLEYHKEQFKQYIAETYKIYNKIPPKIKKYRPFIVPWYTSEAENGLMEPSALILSIQQFTGIITEKIYLDALLSSLWQLDLTPKEFVDGASHNTPQGDKYRSCYARSVMAAATMLVTLASNFPYAGDHTIEGIDVDDPEKQIMVRAWDCEDGGMFIMRCLITLYRFKNYWTTTLVRTAVALLLKHYRFALGKLVCAGDPTVDIIVKDKPELCHVLCILFERNYYKDLLECGSHPTKAEHELVQWPEYMFYTEQFPPPPVCKFVADSSLEDRCQELLEADFPKAKKYPYADEYVKLPPILTLESTAVSPVYPGPVDIYPGGVPMWQEYEEFCMRVEKKSQSIDTKKYSYSLNMPVFKSSSSILKDPRTMLVSSFYNAVISLAVYAPSTALKLDIALGRHTPADVSYTPNTFIDVVINDEERYGVFFPSLVAGGRTSTFVHEAVLTEKMCDLGVEAFLCDRPILHPLSYDNGSLAVSLDDFARMVLIRNFVPVTLIPKIALDPDERSIKYIAFVDPETFDQPLADPRTTVFEAHFTKFVL